VTINLFRSIISDSAVEDLAERVARTRFSAGPDIYDVTPRCRFASNSGSDSILVQRSCGADKPGLK
jgi:hypothetical protein